MITKITIKNIGQHKKTNIDLGRKITIIAAANGTGKTSFSNSFLDIDEKMFNVSLLLKPNSSIDIFSGDEKNSYIYNREIIKKANLIDKKILKLQDPIKTPNVKFVVYNEIEFIKAQISHNGIEDGSEFINIDQKRIAQNFNEMESEFHKLRISILNKVNSKTQVSDADIIKAVFFVRELPSLQKANDIEIIKWFTHAKPTTVLKTFLDEIVVTAHKESKYFKIEYDGVMNNISYKGKNTDKGIVEFLHFLIIHKFGELINSKSKKGNKIPEQIKKFKSNTIYKNLREYILETILDFNSKTIDDSIKESNLKLENIANIDKKTNKTIKSENTHNKIIADSIINSIKGTTLFNKVEINEKLQITDKMGGRLILSTGELKIIDLIKFVESTILNYKKDCIIILDDPLSSVDGYLMEVFISYLKKKISSNETPQIIFLTHNSQVLNYLMMNFKNSSDATKLKWTLNEKNTVTCSPIGKNYTTISTMVEAFYDEKNASRIRLHAARQILEFIAVSVNGVNALNSIISEEDGFDYINVFGRKVQIPANLKSFLNQSSHFDIFVSLNEVEYERRANDIIKQLVLLFTNLNIINNVDQK